MKKMYLIALSVIVLAACKSAITSDFATERAGYCQANPAGVGCDEGSSSSSGTGTAISYGSLTDTRDSKVYKTVKIGTQEWMAENLNYGTYINDGASSSTLQSGAQKFCYNNIAASCDTLGGLYQWHTAMGIASSYASASYTVPSGNIQGICPNGWHLPKGAEWDVLQAYLGGYEVAGSKMKVNISGFSTWDATTYNNGNSSGFSAVPAGYRDSNGDFYVRDSYANFWEAVQSSSTIAWNRYLNYSFSGLGRNFNVKTSGFSIRCIRD